MSDIPYGYCHCGCGNKTKIITKTITKLNHIIGEPLKYINGHNKSNWNGGRSISGCGYMRIWVGDKYIFEHVLIAEICLGKPLPKGCVVHHIDENPLNNSTNNLVICQDNGYHRLLHQRLIAYRECGDPNFRKCAECKQYDSPSNMEYHGNYRFIHKKCRSDRMKEYHNKHREKITNEYKSNFHRVY